MSLDPAPVLEELGREILLEVFSPISQVREAAEDLLR